MKTTFIEFNANSYQCRVINSKDGEELTIGSTRLLDVLQPGSLEDENEGFASKEASEIYDRIFFFTDETALLLPDVDLVAQLKEDNPDWFD